MHLNKCRCFIALLLAVLISSCTMVFRKPDLTRLYMSADHADQPPVIFLHGAFGSKLRDKVTKEEVWPGTLSNVLFGDQRRLAIEINRETLLPQTDLLEPYALFDELAGRGFYRPIINTLTSAGDYVPTELGTPSGGMSRRLYTFIYDWRLDISTNAAKLAEFIDQIRRDFGDQHLKVDLVAHSMGALVARYFIRYGATDVLDADINVVPGYGTDKIRKLIMLGPPNSGTVSGLQNSMMGFQFGLRRIRPDIFATMPSTYQTLPHPDRDWVIDIHGQGFDRSLYDASAWREFGWGIFNSDLHQKIRSDFSSELEFERYLDTLDSFLEKNLIRGKRLHRALSLPFGTADVQYIVFGGDCVLTAARCLVEEINGELLTRLHPSAVVNRQPGVDYERLMLEPGDGMVTKSSAQARNSMDLAPLNHQLGDFPLAYSIFLCERHMDLTRNSSFQDNLLNILLVQSTYADQPARSP